MEALWMQNVLRRKWSASSDLSRDNRRNLARGSTGTSERSMR